MSGRGRGAKGARLTITAKRHGALKRPLLVGASRPTIRHLYRRAGVKRAARLVYDELRGMMERFVHRTVSDAITHTQVRGRTRANARDVVRALNFRGISLYGYGE